MTLTERFGFAGGVVARVALVALYATLAVAAIMVVETRPIRTGPAPAISAIAAPRTALAISIESTYPVTTWTVRYAGAAVAGESGPARWQGGVTVYPGESQLVIEATARDPLAAGPCALRIAVRRPDGATQVSTLWGSGFISGIVALPDAP